MHLRALTWKNCLTTYTWMKEKAAAAAVVLAAAAAVLQLLVLGEHLEKVK
jgi:hypothetical protein